MKNLKFRLIVMNFLQFAVWGAYLTCMGNYLGKAGMGAEISWFYAIQGIVSIFMPALDSTTAFARYLPPFVWCRHDCPVYDGTGFRHP